MPTVLKFLPTVAVSTASDGRRSVALSKRGLAPATYQNFLTEADRGGWRGTARVVCLISLIERADVAIVQSLSITRSSVSKKSCSPHP
jgi:hypothetical protein